MYASTLRSLVRDSASAARRGMPSRPVLLNAATGVSRSRTLGRSMPLSRNASTAVEGGDAQKSSAWMRRTLVAAGVASVAGMGVYYNTVSESRNWPSLQSMETYSSNMRGVERFLRCAVVGASIAADYKLTMWKYKGGDDYVDQIHDAHTRSAKKLLKLCRKNGGIYVKLGQHVAQLQYLLPVEYVTAMAPLLNQCPTRSYETVQSVFEEEFECSIEDRFSYFSEQPIASASLAQVHVAYVKDTGEKVAVKVQHKGLLEGSNGDIWTVDFLVRVVQRLFPEFDYGWLVEEIKTNLPMELDFMHEGANAERCRANFERIGELHAAIKIPEIKWSMSSHRVLVMDFEEGVHIDRLEDMKSMGLDPAEVADLVSRAFSEQIFLHGYVHCDPHVGNLLVRRRSETDSRPCVVLLDHGLYRELDSQLRMSYARLWRAMIMQDVENIRVEAQNMNAGSLYPLFAAVITTRPWDDIVSSNGNLDNLSISSDPNKMHQLRGLAQQYMKEIGDLLNRIPRAMLLLLKTNDCLRTVDIALGNPMNTLVRTGEYCARAIQEDEFKRRQHGVVAIKLQFWKLRMRIVAFKLMLWWMNRIVRGCADAMHAFFRLFSSSDASSSTAADATADEKYDVNDDGDRVDTMVAG